MAAAEAARPIPRLAKKIISKFKELSWANSIPTIAVNIIKRLTLGFVRRINSLKRLRVLYVLDILVCCITSL